MQSEFSTPVELSGLREQIEFWMGDDNLASDMFLRKAILEQGFDGFIPLSLFASFRRMQKIGATADIISRAFAAADSPSTLLELSSDGLSVRRKFPLPPQVDLSACKIIAYPFEVETTEADVKQLLENCCGKVFSVKMLDGIGNSSSSLAIYRAALVRFVQPESASVAKQKVPELQQRGITTVVSPELWYAEQRALRRQKTRKGKTEVTVATEEKEEEKEQSTPMQVENGGGNTLPLKLQPPKFCVLGPVPVNVERKTVISVLKGLAPSGVVVDVRKMKRSKFSDEDPEVLPKPLVDVHLRFVQKDDALAAIDAAAKELIVVAKRPVKIVPLTEDEIREHIAPTLAETLEKQRELGRNPQRQQRAVRRGIAKGHKRQISKEQNQQKDLKRQK